MSVIDDRVVEMRFDNADFERGAKTSIDTLKNLDNSLKFQNGTSGFEAISKAANGINFDSLLSGVASIGHSFSAMEIAAMTVISNITNSVMNAAKNIASALVIEPVTSGMEEYETKMDYVQTTMLNSGKSLEEVNDTLNDLNLYADKTIFKFTDMTSALSKFTMAGITDLDAASNIIKGIGNVAGESGLKAEQASSAFYMISQAMSSGQMNLYQWRTLETTGFASNNFKKNLLETAAALGTLKDNGDGTYTAFSDAGKAVEVSMENLRETLTKTGWFSKEVMEAIFARYASAEASMALGFDDISESAYHAAQDIKTFSQMWDTLQEAAQSGWTTSWEIILGDYEEAKALWTSVNEVISGILDSQSNARNELLATWKELGGRTAIIDGISIAWEKFGNVIDAISKPLKAAFPPITGERLAEMSENFKTFVSNIGFGSDKMMSFRAVMNSVFSLARTIYDDIAAIFEYVNRSYKRIIPHGSAITKWFDKNQKVIQDFLRDLKQSLTITSGTLFKVGKIADGFFSVFAIGKDFIKATISFLYPLANSIFPKLGGSLFDATVSLADWITNLKKTIREKDAFNEFYKGLTNKFLHIKDTLLEFSEYVKNKFGPTLEEFKNVLKNTFKGKDNSDGGSKFFDSLLSSSSKAFKVIGKILSIILPLFEKAINFVGLLIEKMAKGIGTLFDGMTGDDVGRAFTSLIAGFGAILGIGKGWEIMDFFGDIGEALKVATTSIAENFVSLVDVIGGLEEIKDKINFDLFSKAFLKVAIAIGILALAFIALSKVDMDAVAQTFLVLSGAIGELFLTMSMLNKSSKGMSTLGFGEMSGIQQVATALVTFSVAILILAGAMAILSKIDSDSMSKSIFAVTGMLIELTIVGKTLGKNQGEFIKVAKSIQKLAVGMILFAVALKILSTIEEAELTRGIVAIGAILLGLAGASKLLEKDKGKTFESFAKSLTKIAISMVIFGAALKIISSIEPAMIGVALLTIGILLGELVLVAKMLEGNGKAMIKSTQMMLSLAASVLVLSLAIGVLSMLDPAKLVIAVTTISLLIALIAYVSTVINPAKLLSLGAAITLIAAAILIMAVALTALSMIPIEKLVADLLILLGAFAIFGVIAAVSATLQPAILGLAGAFALFGLGVLAVGAGVLAFSTGLGALGVALATFGGSFVVFFTEILSLVPLFAEMLAAGVVAFVSGLAASVSSIVDAFVTIALAIIQALIDLIPKFCEFVEVLIINLCDTLVAVFPTILDTIFMLILQLIEWFIFTVIPRFNELLDAIEAKFGEIIPRMSEVGKNMIQGLIDGIKSLWQDAVDAAKNLGDAIISKVKGVFDINSPSKVAYGIGEFFDLGLAYGIRDASDIVESEAANLGDSTIDSLKEVVSNIDEVIDNDDYAPTITPVVDLSNVKEGVRSINTLLSNQNGGKLTTSVSNRVAGISNKMSAVTGIGVPNNIPVGNNVTFNQNNYSPKALSAIEIYRNTKSQLAQMKGLAKA